MELVNRRLCIECPHYSCDEKTWKHKCDLEKELPLYYGCIVPEGCPSRALHLLDPVNGGYPECRRCEAINNCRRATHAVWRIV